MQDKSAVLAIHDEKYHASYATPNRQEGPTGIMRVVHNMPSPLTQNRLRKFRSALWRTVCGVGQCGCAAASVVAPVTTDLISRLCYARKCVPQSTALRHGGCIGSMHFDVLAAKIMFWQVKYLSLIHI